MTIKSDSVFRREYRGGVKVLVLDWSCTTADAYVKTLVLDRLWSIATWI